MKFSDWLVAQEDVNLGGLPPPEEHPVDAAVKPGHCGAFPSGTLDKSDLPPTPEHPRMKKMSKGRVVKEGEKRSAAKSGLYPAAYGGITLYPDLYYMPVAADHAYYMSVDPKHHLKDQVRVWHKGHGKKPN